MSLLSEETLFETARLRICHLSLDNFETLQEMQSDIRVMQYITGQAKSSKDSQKELEQIIASYEIVENDFWVWAIVNKRASFIGTIALIKDREQHWEIGFRLLKNEWGKGYAREAVEGLIRFVTPLESIQNLIAYADRQNVRAQNVLNKCGFINLGIKYSDIEESEDYIYSINVI